MRDEPRYSGFKRFLAVLAIAIIITHWPFILNDWGWIDLPGFVMRAIDVELGR